MRAGYIITAGILGLGMTFAQYPERMTRQMYFEKYRDIAIHEMERSGVPASITLAQGALESGDGNSRLARNGNNHFGIKCHNDWNGKRIFEDDDAKDECFRKYSSVEESYQDHSDYLRNKSRYAFLFDLAITDYKGWAKGLKKAGYATSSTYANALIHIIEEYDLNIYDRMKSPVKARAKMKTSYPSPVTGKRAVFEKNRVKYIVAKKGDTFETITGEFGKLSWEIPEYNDIPERVDSLVPGQVIFLQPKRKKAELGKETHVVKEGETMYTISQLYAIRLTNLYLMNNLNQGTRPSTGTVLQLRKTVRKPLNNPVLEKPTDQDDEEEIRIKFE
jgi:hypothetical protein